MSWKHANAKRAAAMTDEKYVERWKARSEIQEGGCWLWRGFTHWNGYGEASYRGRTMPIHRAMWAATRGPIPKGMQVCHTCDVRNCINPAHLWLGTNQQNIRDAATKGRIRNRNNGPLPETPMTRVAIARAYKKPYQRKAI